MKYAMALGGGGARGAFEAGVWKAIEELGIEIEAITGTSVGAINGAAFVAGADVCQLWRNIEISDVVNISSDNSDLFSLKGIMSLLRKKVSHGLDSSALKNFISNYIPEEKVRKSHMKFGLCTYSVTEKKSTEIFTDSIPYGELADYITASACFPVFGTKRIHGELFSDGGIKNNLPVNMLTECGYNNIIAVSVRGWGIKQDFECRGVNIVEIEIPPECGGIMDFDIDIIEKNIQRGYVSLMRTFGELCGEKYVFTADEHKKIVRRFGIEFLKNIETAAEYLGLPDYCVYTFNEISQQIIKGAFNDRKVKMLIDLMEKSKNSFLKEKADLLGATFITANLVIYLLKYAK